MENGIINVTNGLSPERFRVSLCALDSSETFSQRVQRPDFECHLVPKKGKGIDWSAIKQLARELKSMDADLVHSHNWGSFLYAVLAAKSAGIPVIHGEHGKNPNEMVGDGFLKTWTKRMLGRRLERLTTVSQAIAAEWASLGISEDKIQWIPNGVDVEKFRPRNDAVEQRRRFGLPEDGLLIGSVGRLDSLKNYGVLIEALSLMPEIPISRLALLGAGPEQENLAKRARELGIADRVFLLGRHSDPENFLAGLDIFVLPSKTEGMSNVVLEAMACGLPLICADLPAHREVFDAGAEGIAVSPCSSENLSSALSQLAVDPDGRRKLGDAARAKVLSRFSLVRMIADYASLYAEFASAATSGQV